MSSADIKNLQRGHLHGKTLSAKGRQHVATKAEIDKNTKSWRLKRFCEICSSYNIDCLSRVSFHFLFVLTCKLQHKQKVLKLFSEAADCLEDFERIDWTIENSGMFSEMNDWLTILDYMKITDDTETLHEVELIEKFRHALLQGDLMSELDDTDENIANLVLHVLLTDIPSAKLLEQKLNTMKCKHVYKDMELRCLRTLSTFKDEIISEENSEVGLLKILLCAVPSADFKRDISEVLHIQEELSHESKIEQEHKGGRLQLRNLITNSCTNAGIKYTHTFEAWSTNQNFAVTTTRQLQLILYFIKTQIRPVSQSVVQDVFSSTIMRKLDGHSVDSIDASAITSVIKTIRLCSHKIQSLLEFRTDCLYGINSRYKNSLSMPQ